MTLALEIKNAKTYPKHTWEIQHQLETKYMRLWIAGPDRWISTADLDVSYFREPYGIYQTPEYECAKSMAESYIDSWKLAGLKPPKLYIVGVNYGGQAAWKVLFK